MRITKSALKTIEPGSVFLAMAPHEESQEADLDNKGSAWLLVVHIEIDLILVRGEVARHVDEDRSEVLL